MPVWPVTLPQAFLRGMSDQRKPALIRFAVDGGPDKVRRFFGNVSRTVTTRLVITNAQRVTFDAFFITDLQEGALSFDWVDPVNGTTKTYRFVGPPTFVAGTGANGVFWETQLTLELLP